MNPKIVIRNETDADVSAIAEVTVAAFETLEISNHTEQTIIAALRAANALTVSLVAEMAGRVVGHIAFSPVAMSDGSPDWYGLGPVSVLPPIPAAGDWRGVDPRRAVTAERAGCPGLLSCGASGVLPAFRIPEHSGTWPRGRSGRRLLCHVIRWTHTPGQR
jgi:hypothetical protein